MTKEIFRIIDPGVLEQVTLARDLMRNNPRFDILRKHQVYHSLKCEANKHSVALELPNGQKVRKGRARKLAECNLKSAHSYFEREYSGTLSQCLLEDTAYLITPELGKQPPRKPNDGMCFSTSGHVYPRNIEKEITDFLNEHEKLSNPVGKAVHAHFHIARIHPFKDGNGRLARLVQNAILDKADFPPIIIEPSERNDYLQLINAAQESYREHRKIKRPQNTFYNYLATKLIGTLNIAKEKLAKQSS